MKTFLSNNGLLFFWNKIKTYVGEKMPTKTSQLTNDSNYVVGVDGKGLSSNDYTTTEKNKLSGIAENANNYTHPSYNVAALGLYKVQVDATGHVKSTSGISKSDITALGIPAQDTTYSTVTTTSNGLMSKADKTKLDAFESASVYAKKSELAGLYKYKGSVDTVAELPATGNNIGDVYDVGGGMNYAWNGAAWDTLGEIFQIDEITNEEIDQIVNA